MIGRVYYEYHCLFSKEALFGINCNGMLFLEENQILMVSLFGFINFYIMYCQGKAQVSNLFIYQMCGDPIFLDLDLIGGGGAALFLPMLMLPKMEKARWL